MNLIFAQPLLEKAYAAFNARDIHALQLMMHPEVRWPNGWEGGYVQGHNGVKEYWTRQWKEIDPKVTPLSVEELEDGRVQVLVQQIVKDLNGKITSEGEVKHIYTIENGLITEMEIKHS